MSTLFYLPQAVAVDSSGAPYAGAKANFYLTGTETPTDTYSDSALTTPNANPVVADAAGQFSAIYLDPAITYKLDLTQSDDTTIYTADPLSQQIATIAGANVFTANQTVSKVGPRWILRSTNASTDKKEWAIFVEADGDLAIGTYTDEGVFGNYAIQIQRTGTTTDEIQLDATLVDINTTRLDLEGRLVYNGTPQTLTGAGAVDLTSQVTHIVTTGTDALTLADGISGQEKFIVMTTDGGAGTLTPTNLGNGSTITFDDVGDSASLLFTNSAWHFMGGTATLA